MSAAHDTGGSVPLPDAVVHPAPRQSAPPNGVWGMALFLAAEIALFGTLIGSYLYLDTIDKHWPPPHVSDPQVLLPSLTTALLLSGLIPMWVAARSSRAGHRGRTVIAITAALAIQCGYLACQILLLIHDLRQFSPRASAYGSIYYTLLVFHHAHVAFGIALDLALIWQLLAKGLTRYWRIAVTNLVMYWCVVSGLAVAVLITIISPSL